MNRLAVQTMRGAHMEATVVADERKLSLVLGEFARTVITDFRIQGILDHLVQSIVGVLPIDAAGVTLISANRRPEYIAASDASALQFEQLQSELGEGPCLAAYATGEAVAVADLTTDERFPLFSPAATAAVFAFPLRHGDAPIALAQCCQEGAVVRSTCTKPALTRSMRTIWKPRKPSPMSRPHICSTPAPGRGQRNLGGVPPQCAHRPPESAAVAGTPRPGCCCRNAVAHQSGRPLRRPGPIQGRERPPRSPHR